MSFSQSSSGQFQENLEGEPSGSFGVKVVEDVVDKLVASSKAQTHKGIFEFHWVDDSASVAVEDVECSFDLPYLVS
jgi:hypothetical protein